MARSAQGGRRRRSLIGRLIRRLLLAVLLVALIPIVLTPLYAVVRPLSTRMIVDTVAGRSVSRSFVPLDAIAPALVRAVIMSEDGQFCRHDGVDWAELKLVLDDPNGPARGASTIPMQVVKNLFLWPQESYVRKAIEIPLALYMDLVLTKRRILEIYLNIAEWGPGIYGAEAAAEHYFGKPASALTAREAALMAAALPNPTLRNPADPTPNQVAVANIIERRMAGADEWVACVEGVSSE